MKTFLRETRASASTLAKVERIAQEIRQARRYFPRLQAGDAVKQLRALKRKGRLHVSRHNPERSGGLKIVMLSNSTRGGVL